MIYLKYSKNTGKIEKAIQVIGDEFDSTGLIPLSPDQEKGFHTRKYRVNPADLTVEPDPDWPPVGYREDPENPGHLIPTENSERERVVAGLLPLVEIAEGALKEVDHRFDEIFSELEAKYPAAEREDWPHLIADARLVIGLSDDELNTRENRENIASIGIEVLGGEFNPEVDLSIAQILEIRYRATDILLHSDNFRKTIAFAKNGRYGAKKEITEALSLEDPGAGYDAIQSAAKREWNLP